MEKISKKIRKNSILKGVFTTTFLFVLIFTNSYSNVLATNDSDNSYSSSYSESNSDDHDENNNKDHDDFSDHDDDDNDYGDNDDYEKNKITICHATHSETNPYVEITISERAVAAHHNHQNNEDIIPAPEDGCPGSDDDDEDNVAPAITLIGNPVVEVIVGNQYLDQGATAQDLEDGNITANIVITNTVSTSTSGTYTVIYNVQDSKGLSATTVTRTVKVLPVQSSYCVVTDTISDVDVEIISSSYGNEPSLSSILGNSGISVSSQKQYQTWNTNKASTTIRVTFVAGYSDAGNVFGYYSKGQKNTFIPLFKIGNGINNTYSEAQTPTAGQTYLFNVPVGSLAFAINTDYQSIEFRTSENILNVNNGDYMVAYDVANSTSNTFGSYVLGFEDLQLENSDRDYNDVVVKVEVVSCEDVVVNTPPVINLIGTNPIDIFVGDEYVDQGATAQDLEDGNITSNLVATSTVNSNVVGVYTVTYNVQDSQGLSAASVSRTVNVLEKEQHEDTGKITFCLVVSNDQNTIATTSLGLPDGIFTVKLSTSTESFSTTTIDTKIWNSDSFSPNRKTILDVNDSDCITYDNLSYGTYNYSTLSINGSAWGEAKYNDQHTQSVNNVFDFFNYEDTNTNADGIIILNAYRSERVLVMYSKYTDEVCLLPEVTSLLSLQTTVNQPFSHTLTASSTQSILWDISTTTLPAGLSFATTTNTIGGTPTQIGTYNVNIKATSDCGFDSETLVINVVSAGGGGGSTPIANLVVSKSVDKTTASVGDTVTYVITVKNEGPNTATNVKVTDIIPSSLNFISATTSVGSYATSTGIWSIGELVLNHSTSTMTIVTTVKSGTEGQKISNTATGVSDVSDTDVTNNTSISDINVNTPTPPSTGGGSNGGGGGGGGGGNGPLVGSYGVVLGQSNSNTSSSSVVVAGGSCDYLLEYLKVGLNNNPVEVRKLQVFLRDFEGFTSLQVTGVYDTETVNAVNIFQTKYKDDILTPWGHTAPTSYTYILTKKKVNEIYCAKTFPLTSEQQNEIDSYNKLFDNSSNPSINSAVGIEKATSTITSNRTSRTGVLDIVNSNITTLSGFSSTTREIASAFTANVISSGKKLANMIAAFFTWPFSKINKDSVDQCIAYGWSNWVNLILIIIIIIISYLWYREYENNKKLEDINKEIDLK